MNLPAAVIVALVTALGGPCLAQQPQPAERVAAPSEQAEERARPPSLSAYWTQFLGAAASGPGNDDARYGGHLDIYLSIEGRDIGLWDGLTVKLHPELVYGESINTAGAGVLLPPNMAMAFPSTDEADADLSFYLVQRLGDASLTFGKINMLDIAAASPLIGGGGLDGFQHTAFAGPPSAITPPTIFGALLSMPMNGPTLTLGAWDPVSAINRSGFEDPFDTGVAGMASLSIPTTTRGRTGVHTITLQATSITGIDLADIPDVILPPESEVVLGGAQGGIMLRYALSQYVWQDPDNPRRGWGVIFQAAAWDDNPLPFRWSAILGVTGSPPIQSRPDDRFGIAYYRMSLSPTLREGLTPLLRIGDEEGAEAFYTFQIGRFARLTANVQYIDPFIQGLDESLFVGARLRLGGGWPS